MGFHIEGIVSRGESDHEAEEGVTSQSYESLQDALAAIGGWLDRDQFLNVVCFYIYGDSGLAWTVVPHFPNLD